MHPVARTVKAGETQRKAYVAQIRSVADASRTLDFVISTERKDRYGDIIRVKGWDLKPYRENPVILFSHMSAAPPIARSLKVWRDDEKLYSRAEFMSADLNPFAESIFRMYQEKFLRAVSVGFVPTLWNAMQTEDGNYDGLEFKKQELLEYSAVPVPANPDALMNARSKGIDTRPVKQFAEFMLDNWKDCGETAHMYGVTRKGLETVRRKASGSGAVYRLGTAEQQALLARNLALTQAKGAEMQGTDELFAALPDCQKPSGDTSVVIDVEEVNGKASYSLRGTPQITLFSKDFLENGCLEGGFKPTLVAVDGKLYVHLTTTSNGTVSYGLIGKHASDFIGELFKAEPPTESVPPPHPVPPVVTPEEAPPPPPPAEQPPMDPPVQPEPPTSVQESAPPKPPPGDDDIPFPDDGDEDDGPPDDDEKGYIAIHRMPSVDVEMEGVEKQLLKLEKFLDENPVPQLRHTQRKLAFLADYMRELAQRLAPAVKSNAIVPTVEVKPPDGTVGLGELLKNADTLLAPLVERAVNKVRGRLD